MKLKLVSIMLLLALAISMLAGCGGSTTTDATTAAPAAGETTTAAASGDIPTIKIVAPTLFDSTDAPLVAAEISKISSEKIGANVELNFISFGAWQDQVNLMLSSGEQIDLMNNGAMPIANFVANGQIQPIDDYVAQYGQGIVGALGQSYVDAGKIGGKLYAITNNRDLAASYGFAARKDLLDKYSLSLDTVKSLSDLEPILQTIKDNEPDLYPLTGQIAPRMRGMDWNVDNCGDTYNLGVLENAGKSTTFTNYFESEFYKNWVNTMYDWAQKGLIMPDVLSSTDSGDIIMKNGKSFGYVSNLKPGFDNQLRVQTGLDAVTVDLYPAQSSTSNATTLCWVVPTSAKYPAEAVKLLNLWNTDPAVSNLFIYGIKDMHYKFVDEANGIIDYADGVDATNIKYPVTMGWNIGNQFISYVWNGNAPDYWKKMDEFNKSAIISDAMGFTFDASQVSTEYAACASVVDQYNNALMCGALDPATALPEFNEALKAAGLEKIIAEKQAQFDAWQAMK